MACAFGMEACKRRYTAKYIRLSDMLMELEMARNDGTYKKVLNKYANPVLLIIDEWLLLKPTTSEQHDILELLHRRGKKSSTIFCSQHDCNGWYDQLGGDDDPLVEAILNIDFFANQVIRHRIFVPAIGNQIIIGHFCDRLDR